MATENLKLVVNAETNEAIYRDFNEQELKQIAIDEVNIAKKISEQNAIIAAKQAAFASANEKLAALGLTPEEIAALRG